MNFAQSSLLSFNVRIDLLAFWNIIFAWDRHKCIRDISSCCCWPPVIIQVWRGLWNYFDVQRRNFRFYNWPVKWNDPSSLFCYKNTTSQQLACLLCLANGHPWYHFWRAIIKKILFYQLALVADRAACEGIITQSARSSLSRLAFDGSKQFLYFRFCRLAKKKSFAGFKSAAMYSSEWNIVRNKIRQQQQHLRGIHQTRATCTTSDSSNEVIRPPSKSRPLHSRDIIKETGEEKLLCTFGKPFTNLLSGCPINKLVLYQLIHRQVFIWAFRMV